MLAVAVLAACAPAVPGPRVDLQPAVDLRNSMGEPVKLSTFLDRALALKYILVGEQHSAVCDHQAQAALLQALAVNGFKPALGLEMAGADLQPVLDRFNAGKITVDQLSKELDWESIWGYDFFLYAPLFRVAKEHSVPVYGLNMPKGMVQDYSRKGEEGLTPRQRGYLPQSIIPPLPAQQEELEAVFSMHSGMGQSKDHGQMSEAQRQEALDRFFRVQALWDTVMAENAVAVGAQRPGPVFAAVGAGHVEHGWGLGHRLSLLDPDAPPALEIVPWRGPRSGAAAPDPNEADLFFYCPATHHSGRLGMTLEHGAEGVKVLAVEPGSRAEAAGLQAGDIVLTAQSRTVESLGTLHAAAIEAKSTDSDLLLGVLRHGRERNVAIPLAASQNSE